MNAMDDFRRRLHRIVDTVGWAVVCVHPTSDEPSFEYAYTVGLTAHNHPELLVSGLHPDVAQTLLNDLARRVYDTATRFTHRQRLTDVLADGFDAIIIDGTATPHLDAGIATARYGADRVRLQQLVWPDAQHRYPWDTDHQLGQGQPLIDQPGA